MAEVSDLRQKLVMFLKGGLQRKFLPTNDFELTVSHLYCHHCQFCVFVKNLMMQINTILAGECYKDIFSYSLCVESSVAYSHLTLKHFNLNTVTLLNVNLP